MLVHMTAFRSLRGRTGVVCDITHLWPWASKEAQYPKKKLEKNSQKKILDWKSDYVGQNSMMLIF